MAATPSLEVGGLAQPHLLGKLVIGGGRTRSARPARMVARVASTPSGECSAISVASFVRCGAHALLRHQHVGEAHGEGLLAGEAAAGVEHQRRLGRPDQRGSVTVRPKPG